MEYLGGSGGSIPSQRIVSCYAWLLQDIDMVRGGILISQRGYRVIRRDFFIGSTLLTQVGRYVRRVGRPHQEWSTEVLKAGASRFGSFARMEASFRSAGESWKVELRSSFRSR